MDTESSIVNSEKKQHREQLSRQKNNQEEHNLCLFVKSLLVLLIHEAMTKMISEEMCCYSA